MANDKPTTLTDRLRLLTRRPLDRCGVMLARLGINPDWITIAGLLLVALAAYFLAQGAFLTGGIILLLSLPLDAVDGAVARALNRSSPFGMVLDSTLDRYADGLIFAAFSYYFAELDRMEMVALSLFALMGSYLVSYIRARADDAKVAVSATVGFFTRMERVIALLIMTIGAGLLANTVVLEVGIIILAIGTNLTALQRLRYVHTTLKDRGN